MGSRLVATMTIKFSRILLALTLFALLAVTAGCGSKSSSQSPSQAMSAALAKTATITSGKADINGSISIGSLPGSVSVSGGGPFDTKAEGGGALDLGLKVHIAGSDQEFGVVAVDGKSYLVIGDKAIEQKSGDSLGTGQISSFLNDLSKYLTNVKSTSKNSYTADVDVKKLVAAGKEQSGSDLSKLKIPGLTSGTSFDKMLGSATIGVTVDGDGYASTMDINLSLLNNGSQGGLRAKVKLSEINRPQTIEPPKNIVKSPAALGGLGAALSGM